jgi:hypothetical protein
MARPSKNELYEGLNMAIRSTVKTSPTRAKAIKARETALDLRRAGLSFERIGERMGVGKVRAHQLVTEAMEHTRQTIAAGADELRAEEIARLDGMLEKLWPKARRGEVAAVDRVLKIGERRAKLLGIEAPVRIETTGKDGKPIEVSSTATIDPSKLSTKTLQDLLDARLAPD